MPICLPGHAMIAWLVCRLIGWPGTGDLQYLPMIRHAALPGFPTHNAPTASNAQLIQRFSPKRILLSSKALQRDFFIHNSTLRTAFFFGIIGAN